ncbi:hypothetical protein I3249_02145 [Psychrobacter sp. Ps1]|uniref:hypothetical protein n=1 Tax=Psychrobacter sp. Ps1 TaxID=2790955 RepID=UPI001EDF3543|nr:hypothetical protein [Psychrobacter sp. Ps1]MCG3841578.1 hypothetical protein [Psychrobacter sp. Ps1]
MRQSHKFLEAIDMSLYRRYLQQLLVIFTTLVFSSYTIAAVTCDAGFVSDNFSNADYGKLASNSPPPTTGADKLLDGIISENYVLAANSFSISGSLDSGGKNTYKSIVTDRIQNFEFFQDFATPETTRTVSYTFKNEFTGQEQELNKVSLSVYDIDSNVSLRFRPPYFEFFDEVTIKGFTSLGAPVSHTVNSKGSTITNAATNAATYRQQNTSDDFACSGLSNDCKVSVTFDNPVARVDIVYGNNTDLRYYYNNKFNNPGDQLINIVFDGYCYKPQPRLTYSKALSTSRKKNTDQFTVQIKDNADNSVVTSGITSVTTTGSNNTVTTGTGTTGTFKVNPTKTYTLTESGSGSTNLADYNALYACRKSDGTSVSTLDPKNLKLTYGDNWTCTITNGSPNYVFSGTVFNDNGGLTLMADVLGNVNNQYFNGIFEPAAGEVAISHPNLRVSLTDCGDNDSLIPTTSPLNVLDTGQYTFNVPSSALQGINKVCLVQSEPDSWIYSVDTTPNKREVMLAPGTYTYDALNFGEVKINNAPLVLSKAQYVHDCDMNLDYFNTAINQSTDDATVGFSAGSIGDVSPNQCIAYRITAYNRGHIELKDVIIKDPLQSAKSSFSNPLPVGNPNDLYISNNLPTSNIIISQPFNLSASGSNPTQATLYFNTKYGN